MPSTTHPYPKPKLFHANLEKNGKVYLLLYKGNKVHVLYDENKNITNLKFRTEITDVESIKKEVDRKLSKHRLEAGVLMDISDIVSIVGGPFDNNNNNNNNNNNDDNNNSTKRIKFEREEIEETSLTDIPRDILRQLGEDLDVYDLFALMLTSKFLYNSLKSLVFSKIYIDFEKIYTNYSNSGKPNNFTHITLAANAKIALEDIKAIRVPAGFEEKFISFIKKHGRDLSNLTALAFSLIDDRVLEVLPDSIGSLTFSFKKQQLYKKLPNRLEYLAIIKLIDEDEEEDSDEKKNSNTFTIYTDALPMSIKVIKVDIKQGIIWIDPANYRLKFQGTFNHPLLTEVRFNGIILSNDLPPNIMTLQVNNITLNRVQLPNTLVKLRLHVFDTTVSSIYNLVNLKSLDIIKLYANDMKFLPRGLEELYIKQVIEANKIDPFTNEGMPQGLKTLDMFEDINSEHGTEGPVLIILEIFPSSMRTLKCYTTIASPKKLGEFLNEGMRYLYIRNCYSFYGNLPSTLVYMNLTVDRRRVKQETYIKLPKSLRSMSIEVRETERQIHYALPEGLEELYLDIKSYDFEGVPLNLVNLKKLKVDVRGSLLDGSIDVPSNVEDLTLNAELKRELKKLPSGVKKFSHGRYQGIYTDKRENDYVGDIFRDGYIENYLPEGIEELTINEDELHFGNCQLTKFKKLRQLEVDVRNRNSPSNEGNLYSLPDNMPYLNLYLIDAREMVHFKLSMGLMKLHVNLENESERQDESRRARKYMKLCLYEDRLSIDPVNLIYELFDKIYEGKNEIILIPNRNFSRLYKGEKLTWFQ